MPPLVALAIGPGSPPLKPLEQVLRDRHAHIQVVGHEDLLAALDASGLDVIVFTSADAIPLARRIRARREATDVKLIGIFPEYGEAFAHLFDEGLAEALCSRTLARIVEGTPLRGPSARGSDSSAAARR
ncbi:MAG: hypothetical protein KC619_25860 [Myxococcales bacterium]|nr:hypothetical protein [Myxococcales bacterium]